MQPSEPIDLAIAEILAELAALEELQVEVRRRMLRIAMTGEPTGLPAITLPPRRVTPSLRKVPDPSASRARCEGHRGAR